MDILPEIIPLAASGGIGMVTGGFTTGFLLRFFFRRFIEQNDAQHNKKDETLKEISERLASICAKLAVVKTLLAGFEALKEQWAKDHDKVVLIDKTIDRCEKDVNAQHTKIRVIESSMEDVAKLISSIRREANG